MTELLITVLLILDMGLAIHEYTKSSFFEDSQNVQGLEQPGATSVGILYGSESESEEWSSTSVDQVIFVDV